jgi:hypothetical protein
MSTKTIDYLFEDPVIRGQEFALVSIVGPHLKQKCDVWGMKVRGVADSIDTAKQMVQRLMRIDNNYDVYIVETGKFFPLTVEPNSIGTVEYQNEQLNNLMKSYLENRRNADEQWMARKNQMVEEAIREGQNQEELNARPEHAIAVLQRVHSLKEQQQELQGMLDTLQRRLQASEEKYNGYTEEEKQEAERLYQGNEPQNDERFKQLNAELDRIRAEISATQDIEEQRFLREQETQVQESLNKHVNELVNASFDASAFRSLETNVETTRP